MKIKKRKKGNKKIPPKKSLDRGLIFFTLTEAERHLIIRWKKDRLQYVLGQLEKIRDEVVNVERLDKILDALKILRSNYDKTIEALKKIMALGTTSQGNTPEANLAYQTLGELGVE